MIKNINFQDENPWQLCFVYINFTSLLFTDVTTAMHKKMKTVFLPLYIQYMNMYFSDFIKMQYVEKSLRSSLPEGRFF